MLSLNSLSRIDKCTKISCILLSPETVVVSLPSGFSSENIPYITGGGLPSQYNFAHFHFHWGSASAPGSEHLIRSKR